MGIMDRFSKFITAPVEEDDDYDYVAEPSYGSSNRYDDDEYDLDSRAGSRSGRGDYAYDEREKQSRPSAGSYASSASSAAGPAVGERRGKVVNLNSGSQLQMVLVKPERFDDGLAIADHLNAKRTVVLNLESASRDVARRLLDFLSGVAYANNGQLKRVSNATFVITPNYVDVMGDVLIEELENGGYRY